jgi:hypothetical protein
MRLHAPHSRCLNSMHAIAGMSTSPQRFGTCISPACH